MVVAELQRTPMDLRYGGHQRQSEAHPRSTAARIAAIEASGDLRLFLVGNAGAVVGHRDSYRAVVAPLHIHRNGAAIGCVFESVVDQVADCLRQQYRIARQDDRLARAESQSHALDLGSRLIEFHGLLCDFGRVDLHETGATQAGVDLGEPQQCVEDSNHAIDVGNRCFHLGECFFRVRARQRQLFQP